MPSDTGLSRDEAFTAPQMTTPPPTKCCPQHDREMDPDGEPA